MNRYREPLHECIARLKTMVAWTLVAAWLHVAILVGLIVWATLEWTR